MLKLLLIILALPAALCAGLTPEQKGYNAIFEVANLTTHIPESFTISNRAAADVLKQIEVFERQGVYVLAAGGYVTAFVDQISNSEDVLQMLKALDMRVNMLLAASSNYTQVLPQWLGMVDTTLECLNKYSSTIPRIARAIHKLYLYVDAKVSKAEPFYIQQKLQDFRDECQGNQCGDTTNILLSGLNGGTEGIFRCDLLDILYQGLPGPAAQVSQMFQKGYRDMVTPYQGFLLGFLGTSVIVQSAYESFQQVDVKQWELVQAKYNSQLHYAAKRAKGLDKMMRSQMIQNAHTTMDRVFLTPDYNNQVKSYNDSMWMLYNMVRSTYSDYHWIITVKQAKPTRVATSSDTFYFNCIDCFTTVDPTGQFYFMVAGVPTGSTPNTNYLHQKAFFTVSNRFNSARELANYIFNGFCLAGIQAISMYEDLGNIYPLEWNGVSERTNDAGTFTIRFWSYQEDCELYFRNNNSKDIV